MGLDQYIYKDSLNRADLAERIDKLEEELSKVTMDRMKANEEEINEIAKAFTERWSGFILTKRENLFTNDISIFIHRRINIKNMRWQLFNNCSVFNFNTTETDKSLITDDFVESFKKFGATEEHFLKIDEVNVLESELDTMRTEVAYWRKYHDLNSYVLETFGGGNCEDTILDTHALESIRDFIVDDGEDATDLDNILSNFDTEAVYIYHPWW